jgi:hypothetical protein
MLVTLRPRLWLGLVTLLAVVNGVFALRYLLPNFPHAPPLPNVRRMPVALEIHAVCAGLALCLGPLQFVRRFRTGRLHARIGRAYVMLVIVGWIASVALAFTAATGAVAGAGFLVLGSLWIFTTGLGYASARARAYERHARFMLWSFACAAAAITLRIELAFIIGFRLDFVTFYPLVAWFCWIPNLAGIWIFLRFNPSWPRAVR